MIRLIIFLLAFLPMLAEAKVYKTLSGVEVNVPEIRWTTKTFILPSGFVWLELVRHARADESSLKEVIDGYIDQTAQRLKIDSERVKRIVLCESRYNPNAVNPKDIDGYKKYGLLQWYLPTYYGAGGKDWRNWKENLDVGMPMMAAGYWRKWPVCSGAGF